MAKFTKLNIGDTVASGSGRAWKKLSSMLQLSAPTLSLDGDTLTITDDSKLATSFDILVDGEVKGTATSTSFDLSALGLESGTYSISVIAKADGYKDSAESESVSYEVAESIVGTWYFNTSIDALASGLDYMCIYSSSAITNTSFGSIGISNESYQTYFSYNGGSGYYGIRLLASSESYGGGRLYFGTQSGRASYKFTELRGQGGWIYLNEHIYDDGVVIDERFITWLKANATKTA